MSTPPQEAETCTVDLTREERWVVHYVLTTRADETIDDRDTPPEWLLSLVETIEDGYETLTVYQARKLHDALKRYAVDDETPDRDVHSAVTISDRLEAVLES